MSITFHANFPEQSRFGNDGSIYYSHSITQKGVQVKQKDIPEKTSRYLSYVLRCWQVHTDHAGRETGVWRFSLQDPRTNQRRGFATLEALLVSLQEDLADDR
jgi:hypothetical protein